MNCPKCQILEMRVDKVKNNQIYYICKKCGKQIIVDIEELKKNENKDE